MFRKFTLSPLMDRFYKRLYGHHQNEPVETTFKNLDKFVHKHGGYRLKQLIHPSVEVKKFIDNANQKINLLADSPTKTFLEVIIQLLGMVAFTDDLENSYSAEEQRRIRSKLKMEKLGHFVAGWKRGKKGGRKMNTHLAKKYKNMLDLWDFNRMRRSTQMYIVTSIEEFVKADGIVVSDHILVASKKLSEGPFAPIDGEKRGYKYDYMTDAEKILVKEEVDQMFMQITDDILKHYLSTQLQQA